MPGKIKHSTLRKSFVLLFFLLTVPLSASADSSEISNEDSLSWRAIVTPFIFANSDDGVQYVFGIGLSKFPNFYTIAGGQITSKGNVAFGFDGEASIAERRYVFDMGYSRRGDETFPSMGNKPISIAKATTSSFKINLASLSNISERVEIGPVINISSSESKDFELADGVEFEPETAANYQKANLALLGMRARYSTTSPIRPTDGVIVDGMVLAGRSEGEFNATSRFDMNASLRLAIAKPLSRNFMLYLRNDSHFQLETPTPLRKHIGGDKELRGEPLRRDLGRRVLLGRAQLHYTLTRSFTMPWKMVHAIFKSVPINSAEIELVPFYDIGVAGDPDYGWKRTRHGYGMGLKFVLPPDLVITLDFATTASGLTGFYFMFGQTI
jgi:hypothetical protein